MGAAVSITITYARLPYSTNIHALSGRSIIWFQISFSGYHFDWRYPVHWVSKFFLSVFPQFIGLFTPCVAWRFYGANLTRCHAPNRFGTVDIGIISPAFRKLKNFFKNIFIGLKHLELRKRKIVDVIPHAGYYKFKKDSDANDMTVQQYYHEMYNIHIK